MHLRLQRIKEKHAIQSVLESMLEVNVNSIATRVLIDSGSVSNLIGMEEYVELKAQCLKVKMEDCHKRLYAYGGKELGVIG